MKMMRKLIAAASALAAAAAFAPTAQAQTPAGSLSELLSRVQSDNREQSAEARQREEAFRRERNQQAALLQQAQDELDALIAEGEQLTAQFAENDVRIVELGEQLREKQGVFGELFGVARQAAGEISGVINTSNVSAQHPGRTTLLDEMSAAQKLPSRGELDSIWKSSLEEMIYQREVSSFPARVNNYNSDGSAAVTEVTRIGGFTAFASERGARFVNFEDGVLTVLPRQPADSIVAGARRVAGANEGQLVAGPIDPSSGSLLGLIVDTPRLSERIQQGGLPGYVILVVLFVGIVFGIFRLVQLTLTNMAVAGEARRRESGGAYSPGSNPLGRIVKAAEAERDSSVQSFELKLDEAIIRESSGLDFGLNFLKLAAAIAPLLGLLGTVTGMILTFQQITLFGTGDPKIMADGISQALVTTVMGLIAAIPLLLIHSFCASASRGAQQVLEEQAAGIVADHADRVA